MYYTNQRMFNVRSGYLFVFLLAAITFASTEMCRVYFYFNIQIEWYYAFFTILAVTVSIWELNRWLFYVMGTDRQPAKNIIRQLALFFVAGSVATTLATAIIVFAISRLLTGHTMADTFVPLKLNLIYAWLANLLLHLINTIFVYFHQFQQQRVEAEKMKTLSVQAELQLIKNQVNPHFLFNNLNVLSALILKNNSDANRFIEEFSKVYRYILHNQQKELVTLNTEIYYLRPYIFLLQTRFGDGLKVSIEVDEKFNEFYIIPAALQMLLENAIKHNVIQRSDPLRISISTSANGSLMVANNVRAKETQEPSTSIGLSNIVRRYALVTNRSVNIEHNSATFSVDLPLIEQLTRLP